MSETSLPLIQRQIIRYGFTSCLALGLLGNLFNCMMFARKPYRRIPSSIYLLSLSTSGFVYLIWSVLPLLATLNSIDLHTQSVFYCKVRLYGSHLLSLYTRYSVVLACIDRYLVTQANVRIRSLSSVRNAVTLLLMMYVSFLLMAIHIPILSNIRNGVCGMIGLYKILYPTYQNVVVGILPPILMLTFSILTMRSLRRRRNAAQARGKQRDRYLMRMVISEVVANVITSIPYSAYLLYGACTYFVENKSSLRLEIEAFVSFITIFLIYLLGSVPFYLFILTSKTFRYEFVNLVSSCIMRGQRIVPLESQNAAAINNSQR